MKIESISFSNFKYVSRANSFKIDFINANSLIMGGPNGYGKTTVFDALELLITGKIRHFNAELKNREKENISVLANDDKSDIIFTAKFVSSQKKTLLVERRFICDQNFESQLKADGEDITDDKLLARLGISKNLFELGLYISQIDSLKFLQQKYQVRKNSITGILDSTEAENKLVKMRSISELFQKIFQEDSKQDAQELHKLSTKKEEIASKQKDLQLSQKDIPYMKLFTEKEYDFDREHFVKDEKYETIISPVDDLIEFAKYQEVFYIKKRNAEIDATINIDKKIYAALFFSNDIKQCKDRKSVIDVANELKKLKQNYEQKKFHINEFIKKELALSDSLTKEIDTLITDKNTIEKGMNDTKASLLKILKSRNDFIFTYNSSMKNSTLPKDICPLCGRDSERLSQLFDETEATLNANLGLIANKLAAITQELSILFEEHIVEKINQIISERQPILEKSNLLSPFLQLSTDALNQQLKMEGIDFTNSSSFPELKLFEETYLLVINQLSAKKKEQTRAISEESYANFQRIYLKYYTSIAPYSDDVLIKKKFYISSLFSSKLNQELKLVSSKYDKFNNAMEGKKTRYTTALAEIELILKKYADANKQYQTSIANNIAVPMFVFSGKILQNYPLGLGVIIEVEKNSVVFKTGNMKSDIFNNLSTGQLNGLIISILLSINEIFTSKDSLKTLLIDDPLQTIDDISAISLIDLLSEHFKDTQIILSTHEDDKQFLIKKKYEQSNRHCMVLNMQEEYLKI